MRQRGNNPSRDFDDRVDSGLHRAKGPADEGFRRGGRLGFERLADGFARIHLLVSERDESQLGIGGGGADLTGRGVLAGGHHGFHHSTQPVETGLMPAPLGQIARKRKRGLTVEVEKPLYQKGLFTVRCVLLIDGVKARMYYRQSKAQWERASR